MNLPVNICKRVSITTTTTDCLAKKVRRKEEEEPEAMKPIPDSTVNPTLMADDIWENFFASSRLQNYLEYIPSYGNVQKDFEFLNVPESSVNIWADESNLTEGCGIKKESENNYSLKCEKECFANLNMHFDTMDRNSLNEILNECYDIENRPCSSSTVDSVDVLNFDLVDVTHILEDHKELEESDSKVVICYSSADKILDSEVDVSSLSTDKAAARFPLEREKLDNGIITERGIALKESNNSPENLREICLHKNQVTYIKSTNAFAPEVNEANSVVYAKQNEFDTKALLEEIKFSTTNEDSTISGNLDTNSSDIQSAIENEVNYFLHGSNFINFTQEATLDSTNNDMQYHLSKVNSSLTSQDNTNVSSMYISKNSLNNFQKQILQTSNNSITNNTNNHNSEYDINIVKNAVITDKNQTERARMNLVQCINSWKIKFPWVEFIPEKCFLSCNICSNKSITLVVHEIDSHEAVYKVATNLLKHSVSEKHVLLQFVTNFSELDKVFSLLRNSVSFSKETLFRNISHIITKSTGIVSVSDSIIRLLVNAIAKVVNEYILHFLKIYSKLGVSYVHDNCKRILIARFCRDKMFPEEIVVTDFKFSQYPLKEYLSRKNLDYDNNITLVRNILCSECQNCNYSQRDSSALPIRMISFKTFHKLMMLNICISSYWKYANYLSVLVKQNFLAFSSISGIEIITKTDWLDLILFNFLRENFYSIKTILTNLCSSCPGSYVKMCAEIRIEFSDFLRCSVSLISTVFLYYNSFRINSLEKQKLEHELTVKLRYAMDIFKIEGNQNSPFYITIGIIALFIHELSSEKYAVGKEFVSEFHLYLQPSRLACISYENFRTLKRSYELFSHMIKIPFQQFASSLHTFGSHLLNVFPKQQYFTIYKILKMFIENLDMRKWDHLYRFYTLIATLPFLRAFEERTVFEVTALNMYLKTKYGNELGLLLYPIVQEGSRINQISFFHDRIKQHIMNFKTE